MVPRRQARSGLSTMRWRLTCSSAAAVVLLASSAWALPVAPGAFCEVYPEAPTCLAGLPACTYCHAGTPPTRNAFGEMLEAKILPGMARPLTAEQFLGALPTALAEIEDKIAQTQDAAADAGTGLIVLTSGGEVTAFGPGSRFGWLHDELGVTPAIEDVEAATHGDPVSFEFLLETDPDRLFVVDRDAATGEGTQSAEQILDNEIVAQTTAWSAGQVVYLDPAPWYIVMSGLTSVGTMIDQIQGGLS